MRGRLQGVVLAIVMVAGTVSCSEQPEPKFAPPDPSPSASTSEASPQPKQRMAPEQVVRAWIGRRNNALRTGDIEPALSLSTQGCNSCRDLLSPIAEIYRRGGSFDTEGWALRSPNVERASDGRIVRGRLEIAGGETVKNASAEPTVYPAETLDVVFEMSSTRDEWLVDRVRFYSS